MTTALSYLRQATGRLLGIGDIAMVTGTPAATFTTTGFGCAALALDEDSFYVDWYLRIFAGTHKDTTRRITTFTKSGGVVVFSPVVTGAIDATDLFELHRDFSPEEINNAINLAIAMVETEALEDKVDESLVVNSLLTDGLFEKWTSSSVLTNWTAAVTAGAGVGNLARESTIKMEGNYSAKLQAVAADYHMYQSVSNPYLYTGQTVSLYAWVNSTVISGAKTRIRLTDGVTTWNSDYHDGKGWQKLSIENVTLSDVLTALTASARVEALASGISTYTAYVDRMWLICEDKIYEYPVPTGFYAIDSITPESATIGRFNNSDRFDRRGWQVLGSTTKKIWLNDNWVTLTSGRQLRLDGQAKPGQLTLDADTTEVPASYIVQQAKALLHQSRITGTGGTSERHDLQMRLAQGLADRERVRLFVTSRGWRV